MKHIIIALSLIILSSCSRDKQLFVAPEKNVKECISLSVSDTVTLEHVTASYIGRVGICGDSIYFLDNKFCWLFFFDKDGVAVGRKLGQGRGPGEIQTGEITGAANFYDGRWIFLGGSNDCHLYDGKLQQGRIFTIDKGRDTVLSYDSPITYTLDYNNMNVRNYGKDLYYNVYSEAPKYNYFENPDEYFKDAKILAKVDLESGKVSNMLGGYPSLYLVNSKATRLFSGVNFDIDGRNGEIFVSYEADSLIYCYDKDYSIKYSFGFKGRDMNTEYPELSLEELFKKMNQVRGACGYYRSLKYIPELDAVVRTYTKGDNQISGGMQIYRDRVLIADIDIPKKSKVIGYINPYIYLSGVIDEDNEKIDLYRIRLEK